MTITPTPWGYSTTTELPALMSVEDFVVYTGGIMSSSTDQISATLDAVSASVRNYCGWHIAPSIECIWTGDADGRLVQLPAMNVSTVHSITVNGDDLDRDDFAFRRSGLIRLDELVFDDWGQLVTVDYTAGVDTEAIASVVSQLAVNALVAPAGVMREQAGDVAITYNQTAVGVSGGVRLLSSDKALLDPFKLPTC